MSTVSDSIAAANAAQEVSSQEALLADARQTAEHLKKVQNEVARAGRPCQVDGIPGEPVVVWSLLDSDLMAHATGLTEDGILVRSYLRSTIAGWLTGRDTWSPYRVLDVTTLPSEERIALHTQLQRIRDHH
ncbi:MAG TPA: hypothetical protein VMT30_05415 [Candidatus Saccharimonadia bacterium]|nr:hypothetical protein [Candidatus Saccharimonadia bacterium]